MIYIYIYVHTLWKSLWPQPKKHVQQGPKDHSNVQKPNQRPDANSTKRLSRSSSCRLRANWLWYTAAHASPWGLTGFWDDFGLSMKRPQWSQKLFQVLFPTATIHPPRFLVLHQEGAWMMTQRWYGKPWWLRTTHLTNSDNLGDHPKNMFSLLSATGPLTSEEFNIRSSHILFATTNHLRPKIITTEPPSFRTWRALGPCIARPPDPLLWR